MILRPAAALFLVAAATVFAAPLAQGQANPAAYEKLAATRSPAVVTIKYLLKGDQGDQEEETSAVMIEKTGLVLVSSVTFGGVGQRFTPPTEIKVLVGDDTQGLDAKILAKDSDLNLTWVQIEKPSDAGYPFVDFTQGAAAKVGDSILFTGCLSKFFDRTPIVGEGHVVASPTKPRNLLIPSAELLNADWGTPVFDDKDAPVGVLNIILPEEDEMPTTQSGQGRLFRNMPGPKLILPASEIVTATKRAKETAASGKADNAEPAKPAEKPAEKPADAAPGMGDK